ncbi:hypothetical protein AB0D11_26350 [Streptomyces monashensis]
MRPEATGRIREDLLGKHVFTAFNVCGDRHDVVGIASRSPK